MGTADLWLDWHVHYPHRLLPISKNGHDFAFRHQPGLVELVSLWTCGVLLRWIANIRLWNLRILLPISAAAELTAFLVFYITVRRYAAMARPGA
jgi:hypothetical protein